MNVLREDRHLLRCGVSLKQRQSVIGAELAGEFLRSLLRDDEVSSLQVRKEVTTTQMLHYNIDVFVVFKKEYVSQT